MRSPKSALGNSIVNHKGHNDHEEDRMILCVLRVFVVPDFKAATPSSFSVRSFQ